MGGFAADWRLIRSGFRSSWETRVAGSQSSDGSARGLALLAGMAVLGSDQTVLKQALDAIRRLRN